MVRIGAIRLGSRLLRFFFVMGLLLARVVRVNGKVPEALFLDRDGTLIEWVHYLSDPSEVVLSEGVAEALKRAKNAGCRLFLHTNQSGVGRGYFTMKEVGAVNRRMYELLGVEEDFFDEVCIAPDDPNAIGPDTFRKPSPRFAREMIERFELDPARCYYVGDSVCDVETGLAAGMGSIGILADGEDRDRRIAMERTGALVVQSVAAFVAACFGE